ncbi:hypothetical protein [Psittacicella hinzii]|nr:hypothetical protein [Psittacicella hinzii]
MKRQRIIRLRRVVKCEQRRKILAFMNAQELEPLPSELAFACPDLKSNS